jgi:phosphatidylglycerol:prolipoprotein diacylglycerol transferase
MYGGFFFALALSVPLLALLDLPFGAFWDATVFTILVGMIFTRVGCLLNGCCAGRASRQWWSLYLPNRLGVWKKRLPTQHLEAALAGVLAVSAMIVWRQLPFPGALFLLITAAYAVARLPLESMREAEAGASGLTLYHALSLLLIASALTALTILWLA